MVVTAPTNFEVSTTTGTGFGSTVSIPYSGSAFLSTTIFVRFKPTVANTAYSGTITNVGGGGTTNVAVTGTSLIFWCTSNATSTADEDIFNVSLGTAGALLNNSSTCSTLAPGPGSVLNEYSNYTTVPAAAMQRTMTYPFSVQVGTCGTSSYSNAVAIYVDFNQNGLLTDAGEQVYVSTASVSGANTITGSFTIPNNAILGNTLMRVVCKETADPTTITPCGTYSWGETEDYYVNITAAPPCPSPSNPTAVAAATSATLGWTENGSASSWDIEWGPIPFTPTGVPTITGATNPYVLTGLTPGTGYAYRVRSNCNADGTSLWSTVKTFYTPQIPVVVPFTEGFETGFNSWQAANGTEPNVWFVGTAAPHTGTKSAYITNDAGVTNGYNVSSASVTHLYRDITFPTTSFNFNLKFNWMAYGESATDFLKVFVIPTSSMPVAGTQLTTGQIGSTYGLFGTWQTENIELASATYSGQTVRLVFSWRNNGSTGTQPPANIDDLDISIITCPKPTVLAANNITTTTADLAWTSTATSFDVELGAAGFTPTGTPTYTGVTNPYTVSGLTSGTSYGYYVRANCGVTNGLSVWAGPFTFTTLCQQYTSFVQNFDGVTTPNLPNCWSKITSYSGSSVTTSTTSPFNGANCASLYNSGGVAADNIMLISPYISNLNAGTNELRFFARAPSTSMNSVIVGTMTDPAVATTFTPIVTLTGLTTSWTEQIVNFATYTGTDHYIAFRHPSSSTYTYLYLDNINWEAIPPCPRPTDLAAIGVTTNLAFLNWTEAGSATAWQIEWGPAGFAQGTGTLINVADPPPAKLPGLSFGTAYSFYVRAACPGGGYSLWTGPSTFTTLCLPVTTYPYNVPFSAVLPQCWSVYEGTTGASYHWEPVTADATYGVSGPKAGTHFMRLYVYLASTTYNPYYLQTDTIILNSTPKQLSYYYFLGSSGYNSSPAPLIVQASSDGGATWSDIYTHTPANSTFATSNSTGFWTQNTISLSGYANRSILVRFKANSNYAYSGTMDVGIDEFVVEDAPACAQPSSLTANVAGTQATLAWTENGTATLWDIEWGATPYTFTGTPNITGVSMPYLLTGLTPLTGYTYKVRASCGSGVFSTWSSAKAFTTSQVPGTIPYAEGFESGFNSWGIANGTVTNKWYTGTATAHTGTQSAYISKDAGVTNTYNNGSSSIVHVYRDIVFPASVNPFHLKFNWKANGESGYDDLRVSLVSPSTTPTAGTLLTSGQVGGLYNSVTTWQQVDLDLDNTVYAGQTWRLVFTWRNDGSYGTDPPAAIDDIAITAVTCATPTALTATAITTTTATLGWTASGTLFDVNYVRPGYTDTVKVTGAGNPYLATGLQSSSNYRFWVRQNCGAINGYSNWAGPFNFATQCDILTNFIQPFDAVTVPALPACWWSSGSASTQTTSPYSAPNCLYFYSSSSSSPSYIVLPPLSNAGAGTHQLRFMMRGNFTAGETIDVGYLTNPTDVSTFVSAGSATATSLTYNEYVVQLGTAPGTSTTLALRHPGVLGYSVLIDNVSWEAIPTCLPPNSLSASNMTTTSADLNWNETGTATTWNIELGPVGFTPTGVPTQAGVNAHPYTYTGLTASTQYAYYVQADCGGGDKSSWAGPYTFATACDAVTSVDEGFNGTIFPPTCWSVINAGTGNTWGRSTSNTYEGTGVMYYPYNSSNAANAWAFTPPVSMTAGNTYILSFYERVYSASYPEKLKVTIGSSASVAAQTTTLWDNAGGTSLTNTTYVHYTVNYNATATGTMYFAFNSYSDIDEWNLYVDKVTVTMKPPVDLALTSFQQTSGMSAPVFENGTTVTNLDNAHFPGTGINLSALVTNLGTVETPYTFDWTVGGVAQPTYTGNTIAVGGTDNPAFTFSPTARGTFITTGTVNAAGDGDLTNNVKSFRMLVYPDVFGRIAYDNGTNIADAFYGWGTTTTSMKAGVRFTTTASTKVAGVDMVYRTETLTAGTIFVQVRAAGATTTAPGAVLYSKSFNTADYLPTGTAGDYVTFPFDDNAPIFNAGTDYWITVKFPVGISYPGAIQNSGFTAGRSFYQSSATDTTLWASVVSSSTERAWLMRSINVNPPACPVPVSLTASNVTAVAATLDWTETGTSTTWDIEYGPAGFTHGAGTMITGTSVKPHQLTGLTASTIYDFYVRANCGYSTSAWSAAQQFTTLCNAITVLPFSENFDAVTIPALPSCWTKYSSAAATPWISANLTNSTGTPHSAPNYMYVTYNETMPKDEWLLTPSFQLSSGVTYTLKFWVKAPGYDPAAEKLKLVVSEDPTLAGVIAGTQIWNMTGQFVPDYTMISVDFTPSAAGAYYFAWHAFSDANVDYIGIDDVSFDLAVTCAVPYNVGATAITATAATINWNGPTPPPGNGYEYEVRTSGAAGSGPNGLAVTGTTFGATTANLTGLVQQTLYHVYVRSNCGDNIYSDWTSDYQFTTLAGVPVNNTVTNITVGNGISNCYDATSTITVSNFIVQSGGSANFIAGSKISFLAGTKVLSGGYMHGKISPTGPFCSPSKITEAPAGTEVQPFATERATFTLYPNPTNGNFTLIQKGDVNFGNVRVEVYTMSGEKVLTESMIGQKKHEFRFADMSNGLYFVKVVADDYVETIKLVKTR